MISSLEKSFVFMSMLQEFLNIFDLEGVFPKVYDLKLHLHVDDRHRTSSVLEEKKQNCVLLNKTFVRHPF